MDIKYNIYYATSANGPWTLANPTPLVHSDLGNSYTVSGLAENTTYYITVVGGTISTTGSFQPLVDQFVGPTLEVVETVNSLNKMYKIKTYNPLTAG